MEIPSIRRLSFESNFPFTLQKLTKIEKRFHCPKPKPKLVKKSPTMECSSVPIYEFIQQNNQLIRIQHQCYYNAHTKKYTCLIMPPVPIPTQIASSSSSQKLEHEMTMDRLTPPEKMNEFDLLCNEILFPNRFE